MDAELPDIAADGGRMRRAELGIGQPASIVKVDDKKDGYTPPNTNKSTIIFDAIGHESLPCANRARSGKAPLNESRESNFFVRSPTNKDFRASQEATSFQPANLALMHRRIHMA